MDTKAIINSSRSIIRSELEGDHPLGPARALLAATASQVLVLTATAVAALAIGWTVGALSALAVAVTFAAIGGTVALIRYRNGLDAAILAGRTREGTPGLDRRIGYLTSRRLRRSIAHSLRARPWVRDPHILDHYDAVARRLEAPEPISAAGMVRLLDLLKTAPAAVAVGSPEAVVRELSAIRFLLEEAR